MDKIVRNITLGAVALGSAYLFYSYRRKNRVCTCKNRVRNKVIIITGANSGIGYEAALQYAAYGAKVYLCCRNNELGEKAVFKIKKETGNQNVFNLELDLCNLKSITNFVDIFCDLENEVDVLIHNAGVFNSEPRLTVDGYEIHFQTNFLGPVTLTHKLLPQLYLASNPRIIFMSSEAHKLVSLKDLTDQSIFKKIPDLTIFEDSIKHYGMTKLALKLYAGFCCQIIKSAEITIASVNPGNVYTNIYRNCWNKWYQWPIRVLCYVAMKSPKSGSQVLIHAANSITFPSGCYISDCNEIVYPFITKEEERFAIHHLNALFSENIKIQL